MAFNPAPIVWLGSGYNLTSSTVGFTTSDSISGYIALPEVTDTEANATTGDIRKVGYGINEAFWQAWNSTATADRPGKMTLSKSSSVDATTGITSTFYTWRFDTEAPSYEVVDE